MGIPKIKTATNLRSELYDTLKEVSEGKSHLITHKQGDPILLLSQKEYDRLIKEKEELKKMAIGLSQIENGEGISHSKAKNKLNSLKKKWK